MRENEDRGLGLGLAPGALAPVEGRSKGAELRSRLEALAHSLGPDAKLPTVETLCGSLRVSRRTLGEALGDLEARGVLRRRQGSGIWVASTLPTPRVEPREVCLVCDAGFFRGEGHSPFWDLLVEAAQERAASEGENLSCHFALESGVPTGGEASRLHVGLAREIEKGRVHGVIAVGLSHGLARWIEARAPLAAFAGPAKYGVTLDDEELLRMGASHLAGLGCKRVAMWSVKPESPAYLQAFERGLGEHGVLLDESLVRSGEQVLPGADNRDMGHALVREVLGRAPRVDGVVISNDLIAHGAILALSEAGVEVGRDIHIATQANKGSLVLGHARNLALMEIDPAEIVEPLFSQLEDLMAGRTPLSPWPSIRPRLRLKEGI